MENKILEKDIQISIVDYLKLKKVFFTATANGEKRNQRQVYSKRYNNFITYSPAGKKLKKMGVIAGVPDLILILNDGKTIWVELKTDKGKQSDSQKEFENRLITLKHTYLIWRSLDDAINFIENYK